MKKLLMIINNQSGVKNSKSHLLDAMDVFCKNGYVITTYITQAKDDAYQYIKNNKVKYDVITVFGGDGTLNEVTNGLMKNSYKPAIGYFPSGTMNDFGSNFNMGSDFKEIAEKICLDSYTEFDVGKFNNKYFNYVAAFGAMCDVSYKTSRSAKEKFGSLAYIFEGIASLSEIKPINVKVTVDGKSKQMTLLFGFIFSGGRVAGQQLVAKNKSSVNDGAFNVLLVDYVPSLFDSLDVFALLAQRSKHIHRYSAKNINLEFEDDDVNWTLDGEEAKPGKVVEISNINKALKIKA